MCEGAGVDVADGVCGEMRTLRLLTTGIAFVAGSFVVPAIYSVVALIRPIQFQKGRILVPPSEAVSLILLIVCLLAALSAAFYLCGLELSKSAPRIRSSVVAGFGSFAIALVLWLATNELLFFFLCYFGFAFACGLAFRSPRQVT